MKKYIMLFFILFALLGCKKYQVSMSQIAFSNLNINKKIYAFNDSLKPYMRFDISYTYPTRCVNDSVLHNASKIFSVSLTNQDYTGDTPQLTLEKYVQKIESDAQSLATIYQHARLLKDFANCYQTVDVSVIDTLTNNVMTLKNESDSYMGGAHGSHSIYYYNISLITGKLLTENLLFDNYSYKWLSDVIQEQINTQCSQDVKDELFDKVKISPNSNFYFNKIGMVYTFNQYEIAPYAAGIIKITIPYPLIDHRLKEEFLPIGYKK